MVIVLLRACFTLAMFCWAGGALLGQSRYYDVWHFGEHFGLDFRTLPPVPLSSSVSTLEGCASICDRLTGEPLFYTDGLVVWNGNHEVMPNGKDLFGHWSTTQSALILPDPGDPLRYYLFTAGARTSAAQGYGLNYSVVDMREDDGRGDVVEKNIPLLFTASEKLAAVRHANGCAYWIITHEMKSDRFYAWLVTAYGISSSPVISPVGSIYDYVYDDFPFDAGYLKASPDGARLFSVRMENDFIHAGGELFSFDTRTGAVGPKLEDLPAGYGATFSPDNSFLYTSDGDSLVQYNLQAVPGKIGKTKTVLIQPDSVGVFYAMQIGPDGKVYLLHYVDTMIYLGVIDNPNNPAPSIKYDPLYIPLSFQSHLGLPNCIDGYLGQSNAGNGGDPFSIILSGDTLICPGEEAQLHVEGGTWYAWADSGGQSCLDCPDPIVSPTKTTTYKVIAYSVDHCPGIDSAEITVTLLERPPAEAGNDTVICPGESIILRAGGGISYHWSPTKGLSCAYCGNPVAAPEESTTYYVAVTGENGCVGIDSVKVDVVSPHTAIIPSATAVCPGEEIKLSAEGGKEFRWYDADGTICSNCAEITLFPERTTTYYLESTFNGSCLSTDSIEIFVYDPPVADAGEEISICPGESVRLHATGGSQYLWSPASGLDCPACADPLAAPSATTTYRVLAIDENGCRAEDSVTVHVRSKGRVDAGNDTAFCPGGSAQLSASGAESYLWSPAEGLSCTDCPNPVALPEKTTRYYVTGTTSSGECPAVDSVLVIVGDPPTVDAGVDTAICSGEVIRLNASDANAYRWDASSDLSCLDCLDPVVSAKESQTYYVHGWNAWGCEAIDSVRVEVRPKPVVDAGPDRSICLGGSLQLQASGGERWLWEPTEGLSCVDCRDPIAGPDRTTLYRVRAWSAEGCEGSDEINVEVRTDPEIIHLQIGRGYRGYPGGELSIPIEIVDDIGPTDIGELELELEYDPGVMLVDASSIERSLTGTILEGWSVEILQNIPGHLVARLSGPNGRTLSGRGILLRFVGGLYLSEIRGTELPFKVRTPSGCFRFETEPGYAEPDSICGLNFRLIELSANKYVAPTAYPNPARERVTFEFGVGFAGTTKLEAFDLLGHRIGLIVDTELGAGRYSVDWDVRDLPSGIYWYRLTSGDWSRGGQVEVR